MLAAEWTWLLASGWGQWRSGEVWWVLQIVGQAGGCNGERAGWLGAARPTNLAAGAGGRRLRRGSAGEGAVSRTRRSARRGSPAPGPSITVQRHSHPPATRPHGDQRRQRAIRIDPGNPFVPC